MVAPRRLLAVLLCSLCVAAPPPARAADPEPNYPSRPIKMIVPFAAGGTADIIARMVARYMPDELGQPVVVDNRGGSGGIIGSDMVAKAPADGYTIALHTLSSAVINSSLYKSLPFDIRRDFAPVILLVSSPLILVVHPSVPAQNLKELIALLRANPNRYSYASSGSGTITHLSAELFRGQAQVEITHVPYRGAGPAVIDLVAGHVHMMIDAPPGVLGHIRAGALRPLGVTPQRLAQLPDLPTLAEAGLPDYRSYIWQGIYAPARTPEPIIQRLYRAALASLDHPETKARMADLGLDRVAAPPAEFAAFWDKELAFWGPIVRASGATPN
jgi:tripartite-type tricarboxylate transporter receptor subunit TctC